MENEMSKRRCMDCGITILDTHRCMRCAVSEQRLARIKELEGKAKEQMEEMERVLFEKGETLLKLWDVEKEFGLGNYQ